MNPFINLLYLSENDLQTTVKDFLKKENKLCTNFISQMVCITYAYKSILIVGVLHDIEIEGYDAVVRIDGYKLSRKSVEKLSHENLFRISYFNEIKAINKDNTFIKFIDEQYDKISKQYNKIFSQFTFSDLTEQSLSHVFTSAPRKNDYFVLPINKKNLDENKTLQYYFDEAKKRYEDERKYYHEYLDSLRKLLHNRFLLTSDFEIIKMAEINSLTLNKGGDIYSFNNNTIAQNLNTYIDSNEVLFKEISATENLEVYNQIEALIKLYDNFFNMVKEANAYILG